MFLFLLTVGVTLGIYLGSLSLLFAATNLGIRLAVELPVGIR